MYVNFGPISCINKCPKNIHVMPIISLYSCNNRRHPTDNPSTSLYSERNGSLRLTVDCQRPTVTWIMHFKTIYEIRYLTAYYNNY